MGQLIVLEGLDGSGKSTLARHLAERLDAVLLSTPGDAFCELRDALESLVRAHPDARQLIYAATVSRCSDLARAHLDAGRSVVVDRYLLSTQVYAALRGPCLLLQELATRLVRPDVTVFVDCQDHERLSRMQDRGLFTPEDDRSIRQGHDLRARYLETARTHPLVGRLVVLDSTRASVSALADQVLAQCS